MSWFKIDDGFWSHPKILGLTSDAIALWVRAGAWASGQLTDGALPRYALPMFGMTQRTADELVECGLWIETDTGYQFHDWDIYQRSRVEVLTERNANRERQQRLRAEQKRKRAEATAAETNDGSDGDSHADRHAVTDNATHGESRTPPDPTRPDQVSTDVDTSSEASQLARDITMLCNLLADQVAANGSKRPTIGKAWHTSARLMLTTDSRDVKKTANLIVWSQQHRFWRSKVMSMTTFRADYDKMRLQAIAESTPRPARGQMPADRARETIGLADVVAAARGGNEQPAVAS